MSAIIILVKSIFTPTNTIFDELFNASAKLSISLYSDVACKIWLINLLNER